MKKKMVLLALVATLAFATTACSTSNSTNSSESQVTGTIETTVKVTETPTTVEPTTVGAVKTGNYIEKGNLKISLESAKQYDEITDESLGSYTAKPADGKKYLVLFFEVENISSEEQNVNMFYHKAYLDDYDIDQKTLLAKPEGYDLLSGNLAAGKKLKGYVCYEVDPDWQKLEFEYKDGITSDSETYDFIVTPDDLS